MVNLINREPPGRLSCLHAFLRSLWYRFQNNSFTGKEAKHIVGERYNPIEFCYCACKYSQATALVRGEEKYCPFLRAESSKSYCYLVNSNVQDTQKSKAVGQAILALEALGLCKRTLNKLGRLKYANLTKNGANMAKNDFIKYIVKNYYESEVINYGPVVGFLHYLDISDDDEIRHSEISKYMGRPNNQDRVILSTGDQVNLNDGDTQDSKTRTAGALQAWLTYTGYIRPKGKTFSNYFYDTDRYYCDPHNKLGYSRISKNTSKIKDFFKRMPTIQRPLSYEFYIKCVGTAREYSQRSPSGVQLENLALKEYGWKVQCRRFLLMYLYAIASHKNVLIDIERVARYSNFQNSPFVIDENTHERILVENEINFLNIAGAPFLRTDDYIIRPRVKINIDSLENANPRLVSVIRKNILNKKVFV